MPSKLILTIVRATFVKNHDTFKNQDPYFKFKYNGKQFKTSVKNNAGKAATWEESFTLENIDQQLHTTLVLQAYDEDTFSDDFIGGTAPLSLSELINDENENEKVIDLKEKNNSFAGKVWIRTEYEPEVPPNQMDQNFGQYADQQEEDMFNQLQMQQNNQQEGVIYTSFGQQQETMNTLGSNTKTQRQQQHTRSIVNEEVVEGSTRTYHQERMITSSGGKKQTYMSSQYDEGRQELRQTAPSIQAAGRFQPGAAALGSLKQLRNEWKEYAMSEKNRADASQDADGSMAQQSVQMHEEEAYQSSMQRQSKNNFKTPSRHQNDRIQFNGHQVQNAEMFQYDQNIVDQASDSVPSKAPQSNVPDKYLQMYDFNSQVEASNNFGSDVRKSMNLRQSSQSKMKDTTQLTPKSAALPNKGFNIATKNTFEENESKKLSKLNNRYADNPDLNHDNVSANVLPSSKPTQIFDDKNLKGDQKKKSNLPRFMQQTQSNNLKDNRAAKEKNDNKKSLPRFMHMANKRVLSPTPQGYAINSNGQPDLQSISSKGVFSEITPGRQQRKDQNDLFRKYDTIQTNLQNQRTGKSPLSIQTTETLYEKARGAIKDGPQSVRSLGQQKTGFGSSINLNRMSTLSQSRQPQQNNPFTDNAYNEQRNLQEIERELAKMIPKHVDYRNLLISKQEMQNFLFNMDYLTFLKNRDQYVTQSQTTGITTDAKAEADKAQQLLDSLWVYLNPSYTEQIQFKGLYDFMTLMMRQAPRTKDSELTMMLTQMLINYYNQLGIQLNFDDISTVNTFNNDFEDIYSRQSQVFNTIEPGSRTRSRGNRGQSQNKKQLSDEEKTNVVKMRAINKYISRFDGTMTVQKLVKAFKKDHFTRFSYRQQVKASSINVNVDNKQQSTPTMSVVPKDRRKYKQAVIKGIVDVHTFKPKLEQKTHELARQRTQKVLQKSLQGQWNSRVSDNYIDDVMNENRQRSKSGSKNRLNEIPDFRQKFPNLPIIIQDNKLNFEGKYKLLMMEQENRDKKVQAKKEAALKKQIEEEDCTFRPNIKSKYQSYGYVNSRYKSPMSSQSALKQISQHPDDQQSNQASNQGYMTTRAGDRLKGFDWVVNQVHEKNKAEEAELTFKPKLVSRQNPRTQSALFRSKAEQNTGKDSGMVGVSNDKVNVESKSWLPSETNKPKGFEKAIERIKKVQKEKEQLDEKIRKSAIGERFNKNKLNNVKAPSFLTRKQDQENKKLQDQWKKDSPPLDIEVQISETEVRKIRVKVDDDLETLARDFCSENSLDEDMEQNLVNLLKQNVSQHFDNYMAKMKEKEKFMKEKTVLSPKSFRGQKIEEQVTVKQVTNKNFGHKGQSKSKKILAVKASNELSDYKNRVQKFENREGRKMVHKPIRKRWDQDGSENIQNIDQIDEQSDDQPIRDLNIRQSPQIREEQLSSEEVNYNQNEIRTHQQFQYNSNEIRMDQQFQQLQQEYREEMVAMEDRMDQSSEMSYNSQENEQLLEEGDAQSGRGGTINTDSMQRGIIPGTASRPVNQYGSEATMSPPVKPLNFSSNEFGPSQRKR